MPKRLAALTLLAALAAGACVPSGDPAREFNENSPMAAIQADGELVVAIPNQEPFGYEEGGEVTGFTVALARGIATALDVDARYVLAESDEMAEMVAGPDPVEVGDEEAHVAFPLLPLTQDLYKVETAELGYRIVTPFFVGHQRLLVPSGSPVGDVDDLAGRRVCSFIDEDTGVALERLVPSVKERPAGGPTECAGPLQRGTVAAAAAAEPDLITMLAELAEADPGTDYEIVGEQQTTVGYGTFTVKGMESFATDVLNDQEEAGGWTEAYDEFLAEHTGETGADPPALTVIDAAALFPLSND